MAISTNALTLAQWADQANDPLVTLITFSLYMNQSVLADVPITTLPTNKINGARIQGNLPTVNWRKINESSVTTSGTATPYTEQLYHLANNIDIDRALYMDQNSVGNPLVPQVAMYTSALAYDINDKYINNSQVTGDADAFAGLRYRLDNPTTFGTSTACKIDGSGVVMSNSLTAATTGQFFELLDQTLQNVNAPDGDGVVLYMNRNLFNKAQRGIKLMGAGGGFDMTRDAYDRKVYTYGNARIHVMGVKADQSTEIITSTETAAGADGSSTFTSLYAVKYGEDTFTPWQMAPLAVQNIGQLPDEPTHNRLFLSWSLGLNQVHTRAIARVYNINVG